MGQTAWGWLIAIYLFLGGLGAGSFLMAAFFELSGWRYRSKFCPVALVGATVSGPLVALGSLLLIFDLGAGRMQPWRILYMFTHFSSVMTWGIYILSIFIPLALVYGFLELMESEPWLKGFVAARLPWLLRNGRTYRRWVAAVGSVFAVATAVYTGVLISDVGPAIPLWSQPVLPFVRIPMLPILFFISAISTGMGLTFDISATIADPEIQRRFRIMDLSHILLIGLENIAIGLLFISALSSGGSAAESARIVLYGPLAVVFWVGVVLVGLAFPFVVHAYAIGRGQHSLASGVGSGVGIVIAGLLLRYMIVYAGIPAAL
ncbi:MAG: polysulfide reductase NrfD [Anaerolineae bacterium]|nr:polysulfide reductase NrfD [Anaerolineae bacterium]